jgi:ABC-2 type transport system ATP-binding protein
MLVSCRAVTKAFDSIVAVREVSLDVPRGGLVGVVGPNGAGKTSLFKMIATLAKPDRGQILVGGVDAALEPASVRRRLGYMPAEFGRFPEVSIEDYLRFFAAASGVSRSERDYRVSSVLALTDLVPRKDDPVSSGSTGIKQRVLIAKTLVHDPELLVLDEPSAGLDPRARIEVREILRELNKIGKTILISSHILADLEEVCDRIVIFERGSIVLEGALDDLKKKLRDARRRTFTVEVSPEDAEKAHRVLAERGDVAQVSAQGSRLTFETRDGEGAPLRGGNGALGALVAAEIEVRRFVEEAPRLEDVFLRATTGGLAP